MLRRILSSVPKVIFSIRKCSCICEAGKVPPDTKLTVLENGVRVATEHVPSPLAAVSIFIEAGSRFETNCNNGITHFLEHIAYKGFNCMNKCQLENTIRCMGAKLSAHTSREIQCFSATCLAEHVPMIVGILSNVIVDLALPECEIQCEKERMKWQLIDADRNPRLVTFDYLHQTAFQGTPLANRVMGTSNNIERFDKFYASTFLCEHYQPYKLAVVGVGNIMHENMVSYAYAKLGHMVGDPCCESEEGPCRFTGSQISYRDDSMPFAHIAIAFEAPGYGHPDYKTLMTAKSLIGTWSKGQGGKINNGSPLARAASTAELCEYFEAFYIAYRDIGLWGIYYISKRMDVEDMLYNVQDQWMKMCTMPQYFEIQRGVNGLKLDYARNVEGCMRSCQDLGFQTMYSCGRLGLNDIYYELKGVNHQVLKTTLEKYIYDRCPAVAAVGPVEGLPEYTRIRAGTYWLRA